MESCFFYVSEALRRRAHLLVMMSSTEGVLSHPDLDFDAVDPGALFVGLPETSRPVRDVSLRPVLKAISPHQNAAVFAVLRRRR